MDGPLSNAGLGVGAWTGWVPESLGAKQCAHPRNRLGRGLPQRADGLQSESEGPAAVSAVRPQLRAVRKGCGAPGLRSPLCIPATKALELRSNLSAGSDLGPAV